MAVFLLPAIPLAVKLGAVGIGGIVAGMGLQNLFGGTPQAQTQKQESKIETPIQAPIKYVTTTTYDQRDYSRVQQDTITNVIGSHGATVGVETKPRADKVQTMTPILELMQTPTQQFTQTPSQHPQQSAEATATTDTITPLLMIGLIAGGGYIVYKEVIKKK
jgi:hypothetical protein